MFVLYTLTVVFHKTALAREWVPNDAQVSQLQKKLTTNPQRSGNKFKIEYTYSYRGKPYFGKTLSFNKSFDSWTAKEGVLIEDIYRIGNTITIYVNPDKPEESVVRRNIRPGLIFLLIFGILFLPSPYLAYKYL